MQGATVGSERRVEGVGVHSGRPCALTLRPAPSGAGRVFVCDGRRVPATVGCIDGAGGRTSLAASGARVDTPEHLLAALLCLGISDVELELEGVELPVLDGSSKEWVEHIRAAGVVRGPAIQPLVVQEPLRVEAHGGLAIAEPASRWTVGVQVEFEGGPSGQVEIPVEERAFVDEVAWARTFVMQRDIERLRAMGRGAGATTGNTVVWGDDGPVNPGGMRGPLEPVRHKLLDLLGDLALLGRPMLGRVWVHRGSHALHHALVRALLA